MVLLSQYTTLPLLTALGATLCPSPAPLVKALAASLGCLLGTVTSTFLQRTKREAARCSVLRVLADHMPEATSLDDLRSRVEVSRKRFAVGFGQREGEAFEDTTLQDIYGSLLLALLDGPAHAASDLPILQRLKTALKLDGIVVGYVHKRAAQVLVSKGCAGVEEEGLRVAVDKLLFLSERAFSDEEPEEARLYEMGRVCKVLKLSDKEAKRRITAYSRALYQQALTGVVDKVDAHTAEVLAEASSTFGLGGEDTAQMNADTYKQIAGNLVEGGSLNDDGRATLSRAREVLQLGERAATGAFTMVVAPKLRADLDASLAELKYSAAGASDDQLQKIASTMAARRDDLDLSCAAANAVAVQGCTDTLRSLYAEACKVARASEDGDENALAVLDQLVHFAMAADKIVAALAATPSARNTEPAAATDAPELPLSIPADSTSAGRLYTLYLARSLAGNAPESASSPSELVRIFEMSEADEEAARVEACQPRLKMFFTESIEKAAAGKMPMAMAKMALAAELSKYNLPFQAVEETALDVYKARLALVADRVLKANEKEELDAERSFLDLTEADVRRLHMKAFGETFERSVEEALGRSGMMIAEARDGLDQLRDRLGLAREDADRIFNATVEVRLKEFMKDVRQAWEEATYTKEALMQVYKERGQDVGDDPSADGSGGELGIRDDVPLEGVRGYKLMVEATKVADFYVGNGVFPTGATPGDENAYPVTVGKYLEDKQKEEMYGIFAWNAVTCQDATCREKWERAKPHFGGILGLSADQQKKVFQRMVSRWCNMFIKQKLQEQGELSSTDISTLTDWVPTFFNIDKDLTKEMVKTANKGMLQAKVLRLLNQPKVTPDDVHKLRDDIGMWDLTLEKDMELTRPQLRNLFRVEVGASLESTELTMEQKFDALASSREAFGLGPEEAKAELSDLLRSRCKGCLVNAVGNLMQGQTASAVREMQRLELLVAFAEGADDISLDQDWEVAPSMRQRLLQTYSSSAEKGSSQPNVKLLERVLGLAVSSGS